MKMRRKYLSAGMILAHFFTRPQEKTEALLIAHVILFILSHILTILVITVMP